MPQEFNSLTMDQNMTDEQVADHFAGFTNSYSIKLFSRTLKPMFRPGMLTQGECSRIMLALLPILLDTVDPYFLKFCARFLTPEDYLEVIDERNISHMCGYPLCSRVPTNTQGNYKIDFKSKNISIVYPYLTNFCSKEHAQSSTFYQRQLSDESLFSRKDVTYLGYGQSPWERQIALLEELQHVATTEHKSLDEVIVQFSQMSVASQQSQSGNQAGVGESNYLDSLSEEMKAFHFQVQERDPTKPSMDDLIGVEEDLEGDSSVIEGYRSIYNHGQ